MLAGALLQSPPAENPEPGLDSQARCRSAQNGLPALLGSAQLGAARFGPQELRGW